MNKRTVNFENTDHAAATAMADRINAAIKHGKQVTVAGRPATIGWTRDKVASVYQNGTLHVTVTARSGRRHSLGDVWVKAGMSTTVVIEDAA